MIKQVEHLRTEFEVLAFRDARLLENGKVDLLVGRSIERIASQIPKGARCWHRVGGSVQEIIGA